MFRGVAVRFFRSGPMTESTALTTITVRLENISKQLERANVLKQQHTEQLKRANVLKETQDYYQRWQATAFVIVGGIIASSIRSSI